MKVFAFFLCLFSLTLGYADSVDPGCWFLRETKVEIPSNLKSVRIQNFLIHSNDAQAVAKKYLATPYDPKAAETVQASK